MTKKKINEAASRLGKASAKARAKTQGREYYSNLAKQSWIKRRARDADAAKTKTSSPTGDIASPATNST